jgi:hypothetical protein
MFGYDPSQATIGSSQGNVWTAIDGPVELAHGPFLLKQKQDGPISLRPPEHSVPSGDDDQNAELCFASFGRSTR